jgi:MFS family permease
MQKKFGLSLSFATNILFVMTVSEAFLNMGTTFLTSRYGRRTLLMSVSSFLIFLGILMMNLLSSGDGISYIIMAFVLFGLGRGMLASIIYNCIGMVTNKENLAFQTGLYFFSCNMGHVTYLTIFATITESMSQESYDQGLVFLVSIIVLALFCTLVLFVVDGRKGWILMKLEQKRN